MMKTTQILAGLRYAFVLPDQATVTCAGQLVGPYAGMCPPGLAAADHGFPMKDWGEKVSHCIPIPGT